MERAFTEYVKWEQTNPFPKLSNRIDGILPGEHSVVLSKGGVNLGIVALNSAFLQLVDKAYVTSPKYADEPFQERLALEVRQLHTACGGNGPRWLERDVDLALLLTHHPPNWLHPKSYKHFRGEMYVPGGFAAHLYGHMHEHAQHSLSEGGAEQRRSWQGTSLFGLETRFGTIDRRHGFTVGQLTVHADNATVRLWPRSAYLKQGGDRGMEMDVSTTLEADGGTAPLSFPITRRQSSRRRKK